jgi:hypothetical protein
MPTKPGKGEKQQDFISRCIEIEMKDGTAKDNKQAAAICYSKWREHEKGKSIAMSVTLKTDRAGRRIMWRAIANSGKFDQQGDRFDETFFQDLVENFWDVQDAVSRGQSTPLGYAHPDGKPIPQLDIAHYSFQLPKSERVKARAGFPVNAYIESHNSNGVFYLRGSFDITPLGQAASKSVLADDEGVIKTSIGVWPDWERVEVLDDGRRVFKGGAGVAYLDHLALTAYPVDALTEISAEGEPMAKSLTVADDALKVLQDEELVKQLEAARAKIDKSGADTVPDGALAKADDVPIAPVAPVPIVEPIVESIVTITHETTAKDVTTVEKDNKADAIDAASAQLAAQIAPQTAPQESPMMMSLAKAQSDLADVIKTLASRVDALEKSLPNLGTITELATALNSSIEATKATEAQKVKSMLDNCGWLNLAELYSARSATDNTVDGEKREKGPQETNVNTQRGGPIAGSFIRT